MKSRMATSEEHFTRLKRWQYLLIGLVCGVLVVGSDLGFGGPNWNEIFTLLFVLGVIGGGISAMLGPLVTSKFEGGKKLHIAITIILGVVGGYALPLIVSVTISALRN